MGLDVKTRNTGIKALAAIGLLLMADTTGAYPNQETHPQKVSWAKQGWSQKSRDFYHFASQGTYLTQTDWFLALELPKSTVLISDPVYLTGLGLMVEPKSAANPFGLPIGLAVGSSPSTNMISVQNSVGITCAMCHSGQITYGGKTLRFDGLGAVANVTGFANTLTASILDTYNDPAKWDRFSHRVLGANFNATTNQQLRTSFYSQVSSIEWVQNNTDSAAIFPVTPGYGRNDAIASIGNNVFGKDLREPSNYHVANANVSFPFLWNAWKFDWVQYDGSVTQPMQRNVGEALGVGALTNYLTNGSPTPFPEKWKSSININNLAAIETTLQSLQPPAWPAELFGKFNAGLAKEGRTLFNDQCGKCHGPTPIKGIGSRYVKLAAYRMPLQEINTDPLRTTNASSARFDPSKLLGVSASPEVDLSFGLDLVTEGAKQYFFDQEHLTFKQESNINGNRPPMSNFQPLRYKARTLEGVWATAPYLHNGSVPNIYELLGPVELRSKQFWVGLSDYDPILMGVGPKQNELGFLMDTTLAGNSNSGHEFKNGGGPGVVGRLLSRNEKMAIIEYLKAITVMPPAKQPAKSIDW
jgi:cytochrome c5